MGVNKKVKKRRKSNGLEVLVTFVLLIIISIVRLVTRIILFAYDTITIYTSKYSQKSGNGFFKTYFNIGNYGEFKLYRKVARKFGRDKVYTNVYLDNKNTDHTEIDVIALSSNGIYVFEMKNYSGYIYGSENDEYWTQVLNKFTKNKFYNPLRQNYVHCKAVERYLELKENAIIPVIVFSNHSKLSKINISKDKNVLQIKDVMRFIKNTSRNKDIVFLENEIKDFSVKLIDRSRMPQEIKSKHIEQVTAIQNKSNLNHSDKKKFGKN